MKLIVGLGNTGKKYHGTRHNAGFLAVRWLAESWGVEADWTRSSSRHQALILRHTGKDVILAQPGTMMNESGRAVRALMDYYRLELPALTVIHDDADLALGELKAVDSTNTGAGHHGVLSVIEHVGPGFRRLRVGIGRPRQAVRDISDYVLSRLTTEEKTELAAAFSVDLEKQLGLD